MKTSFSAILFGPNSPDWGIELLKEKERPSFTWSKEKGALKPRAYLRKSMNHFYDLDDAATDHVHDGSDFCQISNSLNVLQSTVWAKDFGASSKLVKFQLLFFKWMSAFYIKA